MQIEMRKPAELVPYINNPRKNDGPAVDKVASSIKNFGFKVPIVVDASGEIVAGHTRHKAALKLGLDEVPVVVASDLTPAQIKAFRIADNRVAAESEWDDELLRIELEEIGDIFTGFDVKELNKLNNLEENPYTKKVEIPQYQPVGDRPELSDLVDDKKTQILIEEIAGSNISKEEKEFLVKAAYRHQKFSYKNVAEYYCHAGEEMQKLMERSALVLIDYDDAIKNGYVVINDAIEEMLEDEME